MDKERFASTIQNLTNQVVILTPKIKDIFETYFDRGYNGGGSDPIIDGDVTGLGLTAAEIAAFITFAENWNNFLNNQAVFQSDYANTLNNIRTDI